MSRSVGREPLCVRACVSVSVSVRVNRRIGRERLCVCVSVARRIGLEPPSPQVPYEVARTHKSQGTITMKKLC